MAENSIVGGAGYPYETMPKMGDFCDTFCHLLQYRGNKEALDYFDDILFEEGFPNLNDWSSYSKKFKKDIRAIAINCFNIGFRRGRSYERFLPKPTNKEKND